MATLGWVAMESSECDEMLKPFLRPTAGALGIQSLMASFQKSLAQLLLLADHEAAFIKGFWGRGENQPEYLISDHSFQAKIHASLALHWKVQHVRQHM